MIVNLLVDLRPYLHLWPQTEGSDRRKKIKDANGRFLQRVPKVILEGRMRSSVIQKWRLTPRVGFSAILSQKETLELTRDRLERLCLCWLENSSVSSQKSWRLYLGRKTSEHLCLGRYIVIDNFPYR